MELIVSDSGKVIISDQVTAIDKGDIYIVSGGTIENSLGNNALEQLTAVTNSYIDLRDGDSPGLNRVTDISGSCVELSDGSVFTLAPSAAPCQLGGDFNYSGYWEAYGEGTVIDLSTLPGIQGSGYCYLDLYAWWGGQINMSNVPEIPNGVSLYARSIGADSVIDLTAMTHQGDIFASIGAEGGKIVMDQTSFDLVGLAATDGGKFERSDGLEFFGQITKFTNGRLFLGGEQSVTLSNCVDVGGSDLSAYLSSSLALNPSITDFALGGDYLSSATWEAENRYGVTGGGVLDLSSLETISATGSWDLYLYVLDGGKIDLGNIKSFPADGCLDARVYDPDSLLDLSSFEGLGGAGTTADISVYDYGTVQFNSSGTTDLAGINLDVGETGQVLGGGFDLGPGAELTGDGLITGDVLNSVGTVSPGESPGILTIEGDYTQGAGGTLLIDIWGATPGEDDGFDVLQISGDAMLDGTLEILKSDSFDVLEGMEFVILDLTDSDKTLSGFFTGLPEGAAAWTGADNTLFITYMGGNGNDVMLFSQVPEPTTIAMLVSGGLCLVVLLRRKRSAR